MKYLVGTILIALVLLTICYFILGIWGISLFDAAYLNYTYQTIGLVLVAAIVLMVLGSYFFRAPHKNYDTTKGNVAHPKKEQ
ncbi:MAG: hypothetical protein LBE34_16560 [Flavobacteriaceae bacterium]|jgi:membrane protein implicated in regulation of membrane protease activity|nr:hypothetical protein [Flavobacteriaceae bacterium]